MTSGGRNVSVATLSPPLFSGRPTRRGRPGREAYSASALRGLPVHPSSVERLPDGLRGCAWALRPPSTSPRLAVHGEFS